jgi:hypothetical protein
VQDGVYDAFTKASPKPRREGRQQTSIGRVKVSLHRSRLPGAKNAPAMF